MPAITFFNSKQALGACNIHGWLNENVTSQQNSRPKWKMEDEWGSSFQGE